eukprot:TRINITY_DN17199_c0_g1_i1.p3 TRINITY_DN17199_c0_g1~~TRINITY_DN17199_c0_g1_i1.p3  ORF type:complete len:118 (-),score=44.28 TRINITY_DN17199_c0_g1_i1:37-390(-)
MLRPAVANLKDRLGPHDLTAAALGALTKAALALHLQYRTEEGAVENIPLPRVPRENLALLDATAREWVALTEQLDPSGADCAHARCHLDAVALVNRLEGLGAPSTLTATAPPNYSLA